MFARYAMNREELEDLIAKAKAAGVPCPKLEAKLAQKEYNEPWEDRLLEIEFDLCGHNQQKRGRF